MRLLKLLSFLIISTNLFAASEIEEILQRSNNATYKTLSTESYRYAKRFNFKGVGPDPVREGEQITFKFQHWIPKRNKKSQVIVVNPPTGGKTFLDTWVTKVFVKAGHEVLLITDLESSKKTEFSTINVKSHDAGSLRGVAALKYVTQKVSSNREIYFLGTSLGGIFSALYIPFDERVTKSIFVVAGAPLSQVVAYSNQEMLINFRKKRMKHYNLRTIKDYENLLVEKIKFEPFDYLRRRTLPKSFFFIARNDKIVPTRFQRKLMREFPNRQSYEFWGGHVGSILKFGLFQKAKALKFLNNKI